MKTNPEFDNFTDFMDKLARVPHNELKVKLDAQRAARKAQQRAFASGGHITLDAKDNVLLDVANEVFKEARRRKVN